MLKQKKMCVKHGVALGSIFGYLFGIILLFGFDLKNASVVCLTTISLGLIIGLLINFIYNTNYNKNI